MWHWFIQEIFRIKVYFIKKGKITKDLYVNFKQVAYKTDKLIYLNDNAISKVYVHLSKISQNFFKFLKKQFLKFLPQKFTFQRSMGK